MRSAAQHSRSLIKAIFTIILGSAIAIHSGFAATEQKAHPDLLELQRIQQPVLKQLGERVYATEFIDYANFGFIEGDDGIIVIDGGWFPSATQRAVDELRAKTDKPVVAIIYTHLHMDHFGGMGSIMAGQPTDIPVYGPKGWEFWVTRLQKSDRESILRRVYLQMGMVLPRGEDGTVGNGIGPSPVPEANDPLSFPPTIDVDAPLDVVIAGVPLKIMPMEGDVHEHLWVWLPEDKVLFSGDSPPHGVFPAVETARFEIGRDAEGMLEAVDTTLALAPEHIAPGHSRILSGQQEITEIMTLTRDAIAFLVDQVNRFFLSNRSVDELLDQLHLPPAIAAHPELQPYYHRWEWMMRQRFIKKAGFIDDSMDYLSLNAIDEAERLVPLLGGKERVMALADSLAEDDPRWAARLATYVLLTHKDDAEALAIRQRAFLKVAQTTRSTNERNYLLGLIGEERGEIDFAKQLAPLNTLAYSQLSSEALLERLKSRFIAEAADGVVLALPVRVADEYFVLHVRNNVLRVDQAGQPDEDSLEITREQLIGLTTRTLHPSEVITGSEQSERLAALIEA